MRAVVQRVSRAGVTVAGETVGEIGAGMLVLLCALKGDTDEIAAKTAAKLAALRIFEDGAGKMNLSLDQAGGEALVVSQFTLAADLRRGNRPGFDAAAPPDEGKRLCEAVVAELGKLVAKPVRTGRFGATMRVSLDNEGPATFVLDVP
ncbi:MAG: D-tyrosyl-tRNA(Tyr) deacylase [Planctomycetia bacterium]|nr:D-tyrosyl-tRNA(Tyr) deacylase [Planctomycetia bacterium]